MPPAHCFFKKRSILENLLLIWSNLEAVLNCLKCSLRWKIFIFFPLLQSDSTAIFLGRSGRNWSFSLSNLQTNNSKQLLNKNRKTFSCFFSIHGIASVKRLCLPFGNTFGLFCFPRVHPALSGSVYPTYRLPRVLLGTPMGDIIPLLRFRKAIRHPHGDLLRTLGKHIRLFSFSESVWLLFWVTPTLIFLSPKNQRMGGLLLFIDTRGHALQAFS